MHNQNKSDWINHVSGNSDPLFFILGPCALESESHTLKIAEFLKKLSEKLRFKFVFKGSYDKANRTSLGNARGLGIEKGLSVLAKVKTTFDIPVITDVHETWQIEPVAAAVDIIQIPAFLCRQTDLLLAAGKTAKIVHVKKGQFLMPEIMEKVVKKIESTGNKKIWLCERGFSFGYDRYVVDYRGFPIMKQTGCPVIFDVTHSVQRPNCIAGFSGGERQFVPSLAAAAVATSIAGIFMEVHDTPEKALSDGPNSVKLSELEPLLKYLIELDAWTKAREFPQISK